MNYSTCITIFNLVYKLYIKSLDIYIFIYNFHSLWKASQDVEDMRVKNFTDTAKVIDV